MSSTINFGIDLGTSNSLIAKFDRGGVEVFKNPNGLKETLPSVVGYRNDRILVGEQARTYAERDPGSVVSRFKRKMGTSETFRINSIAASRSPIELSALVLKELKQFIHTGEQLDAAVVTIPASFDTVQSNATKAAGQMAGLKTVVLLQEPIAASLAYANKEKSLDLRDSQWLVYDLGGGTFDVALVRIVGGELTVVDHEGDNYLGGTDFDALLVEKVIAPELQRLGSFADLVTQMKSESGRYNRLWTVLLHKAEEAKIELSTKPLAEIDLGLIKDLRDDTGKEIDSMIPIARAAFESIIRPDIDKTVDMMRRMLARNALAPPDLKFILMVGGSTYIPHVRHRVEETMGIPVNTGIDPTNAIAVGAAYFAGSNERPVQGNSGQTVRPSPRALKVRTAYNRNSQELEETLSAKVEGDASGLHYRITRDDGAFDSGLKTLSPRIAEDLPLRPGAFNLFTLRIFDSQNNQIAVDVEPIQIAQGRYSVAGQMLPDDLSLVRDDLSTRDTRLDLIFARNTVLPTKAKKTVEVAKTVAKDSTDELRIMVVEGPAERHASTNKPIGILVVTGRQVSRDLFKGTEIDLTFDISESRDLTVSAYLNGTGQTFSQVFDPRPRAVPINILASEVLQLENRILDEQREAERDGNTAVTEGLGRLTDEVRDLISDTARLAQDDVTDDKFKLEDKKRRLAQAVFELTSGKRLDQARARYITTKSEVASIVKEAGNERERHHFAEIIAREPMILGAPKPEKILAATAELDQIRYQILFRTPDFLVGMFDHLVERQIAMTDQPQATRLIENGRRLVTAKDWNALRQINARLLDLMPEQERATEEMRHYTGIV